MWTYITVRNLSCGMWLGGLFCSLAGDFVRACLSSKSPLSYIISSCIIFFKTHIKVKMTIESWGIFSCAVRRLEMVVVAEQKPILSSQSICELLFLSRIGQDISYMLSGWVFILGGEASGKSWRDILKDMEAKDYPSDYRSSDHQRSVFHSTLCNFLCFYLFV